MLPFEGLKKDLTRLQRGGINALLQDLIANNAQIIKGLQTNGQMYAGIKSDGTEIEPEYKNITKLIKSEKGQPYDRVTLKDTGSFYKRVYISLDNQGFELDSSDSKRDKIVTKYTEDIFGLTPENKRALASYIKGQLINEIKQRI
jgi:hypothetical protein